MNGFNSSDLRYDYFTAQWGYYRVRISKIKSIRKKIPLQAKKFLDLRII